MYGKRFFGCVVLSMVLTSLVSAKDYKVAVLKVPPADSIVELFKAIGEITGNNFVTDIVPPARAIYMIENGLADVTFPATTSNNPNTVAALKFDYSTVVVYKMAFVLYTNKSKPIDVADLKKGNKEGYKIETTGSLAPLFEFSAVQTTSIEASLKKVDGGQTDGLLYAQEVGDPLVKSLGLKNIHRQLYSYNGAVFGIKKGTAGGELDKALSAGIAKLKADGRLPKILESAFKNSTYAEWQP